MAIVNIDQLVNALANNNSRNVIDKTTVNSLNIGLYGSTWRASGVPGQGPVPTTAVACDNTTVGAIPFTQQVSPSKTYIAWLNLSTSNNAASHEIRDRLGHQGGLNGTLTTAQTVGLDLGPSGINTSLDRLGSADYSDVQWFLEWYVSTGSTAVTGTVNVTYDDGSTGNISVSITASRQSGIMQPIVSATAGRYIRAVNNITLSATTGTAGNFGVTATRLRTSCENPIGNFSTRLDWAALGLPDIANGACLTVVVFLGASSTGNIRGNIKFAHG